MSALGDVAMTVPVIYSVAQAYPELEIYVLTRPFFARVFINRPPSVHIIAADFDNAPYKGAAGMRRLLRELRGYKFDYVADLHNVMRSWIIDRYMRLLGKKVEMVNKYRSDRVNLLRHSISAHPPFNERYLDTFARLGFPAPCTFRSVFTADAPAPELPITVEHPAVGIAPFARYYNKSYPAEMMQEVVESLSKAGVNVYLFGARGTEAETLQMWSQHNATHGTGTVHSVAGRYTLDQEMAIMSALDVMVSMDSANQHLAALAGCPVVTIWGSTTPGCGFAPYGRPRGLDILAGCDCQPCTIAGGPDCPHGDLHCLRLLAPSRIVSDVLDQLSAATSSPAEQ